MRWLWAGLVAVAGTVAQADDIEYEITLYLQPDRSGANTQNKSIELEGDELTIEESGEARNRYDEREATKREMRAIIAFVEGAVQNVDLTQAPKPDYPHIEVQVEVQTGATELEVTRIYPAGALPADVMDIQNRFFETVFE